MMFDCGLQNIFRLKNGQSRSINYAVMGGLTITLLPGKAPATAE